MVRSAFEKEFFGFGDLERARRSVTTYKTSPEQEQKRMELLNPPAPELPEGAAAAMGGLASAYSRTYGQARKANEIRYQQMLRVAKGESKRQARVQKGMMGLVAQESGQRAADIRAEGVGRESDIMQQLARQGMAGTTVAPTLREGVRRGTGEQLNRLSDLMLQRKLGIKQQQAAPRETAKLGIMERRTDAYPDPSALTGAFSAVGRGYGGTGMTAMLKSLTRMQR